MCQGGHMTSTLGRGLTARQLQLFDQLVELFLAEGFGELTLDGIATRLRCSKTTLYALAGSREQLVWAVVVHFFRGATARVEARLSTTDGSPSDRIAAYLNAVATELSTASAEFFDDVAAFLPAREVYERNTRAAAVRVHELISDGVGTGAFREVPAAFIADVVASTMVRIQRRQVAESTGLDDAHAYAELAALVTRGIAAG